MNRSQHQQHRSSSRCTFPVRGGETGELIRARDWNVTTLGPVDEWSSVLCTTIQNILTTSFAKALMWGEDFIQVYNDAFASLMGSKHPDGFGRPTRETWREVWDEIGGLLNQVRQTGEPFRQSDMLLQLDRRGFREDVYFTFAYSPVFNDHGDVEGVMITLAETTEQVVSRRRLKTLGELGENLSQATDARDVLEGAAAAMDDNCRDLPFVLMYAQDDESERAHLVEAIRLRPETSWSPPWIELPWTSTQDGPFGQLSTDLQQMKIELEEVFGGPPDELQNGTPKEAWAVPMMMGPKDDETCVGYIIFGINPAIPFDDNYRNFLTQVAKNIAVASEAAREHEEQLDLALAKAELKRSKMEAHHFKERAQLLDSLREPFYALDNQWRVIYANRAAREDPHWKSRHIVGQNFWKLISDGLAPELETTLRHTMETGVAHETEVRSRVLQRDYYSRVFAWEHGICVIFRDITEQKDTAEALRRSEDRFRAVVDASLDVIAITDDKGHFLFVSPAAEEVLHQDREELLEKTLFDVLSDEGARHARKFCAQLLGEPEEPVKFRVPLRTTSDEQCWLSIRARNALEREGVEGILLNIRDITEIKRFESELMEARDRAEEMTRLKSSILTNMSHEIRTPLTSMIGMASVLADEVPDHFRDYAQSIERGGMRLAQTLDSVLTLAQIEGEVMPVELVDVELVTEVENAVESLKKLSADKGLQLQIVAESSDEPLCVRMDTTFLTSILNNLIGNAVKFTEEGGVTVRISGDDEDVVIEVEDTGIGINEDFLPHVFEEFRQASTGLGRTYQGTGLGLTITRRMVEAQGGVITVFSTKDVATTFTVSFPRLTKGCSTAVMAGEESEPTTPEKRGLPKVLAVEDDQAIRSVLKQLLSRRFDVTAVGDAGTAIDAAGGRNFDLVLLDIGLPDMDGVEALHHLRAIKGYEHRPIVALTGYALPDDQDRFVEQGFTHYIAKPFAPRKLIDTLQDLL